MIEEERLEREELIKKHYRQRKHWIFFFCILGGIMAFAVAWLGSTITDYLFIPPLNLELIKSLLDMTLTLCFLFLWWVIIFLTVVETMGFINRKFGEKEGELSYKYHIKEMEKIYQSRKKTEKFNTNLDKKNPGKE